MNADTHHNLPTESSPEALSHKTESPSPRTELTAVFPVLPVVSRTGEAHIMALTDIQKARTAQIPAEMLSLMMATKKGKVAPEVAQSFIPVIHSAYQELHYEPPQVRSSTTELKPKQRTFSERWREKKKKETLEAIHPERVKKMAEALHRGYQSYHQLEGTRVDRVLREFSDAEGKKHIIDLLQTEFQNLPDQWQKVNEVSARNILMILEILFDVNLSTLTLDQKKELSQPETVFRINSALYDVWSKRKNTSQEGRLNNPLFHRPSYREFREISRGQEPIEGWSAFLTHYRDFLKQNKETYARLLQNMLRKGTSGNTSFQEEQSPGSVGTPSELLMNADTDKDKEISDAEIDAVTDAVLKDIIKSQAISELDKDVAMMVYFLTSL